MNYRLLNNIGGWLVFALAAFTYISTIEPTTSFWDCGEFIATAYKLEVGHPPGAPLFMILARVFSLFTTDVTKVAMMVNILSALASAFTIMFLFWTITHFARKIVVKTEEMTGGNLIAVLGSGLVGALAYTWSDTFWFSAVEGEVYATSSLFTAVVFWAILKWDEVAHEQYSDRWLVLIAFLMGLSIGIHLLNLLAIPAIVFVYYFKKYEITRKGIIMASLISIVILAVLMYGVIPGVVTMASNFELLFVNSFGLSYNWGVLIYAVLLIASLVLGLYFTTRPEKNIGINVAVFSAALILLGIPLIMKDLLIVVPLAAIIGFAFYMTKRNKAVMNTILLCCTVILIGYSSFSMIVIRSVANPPMDENNPDNVFALLSYLNREQYGDRPLIYGQSFNAELDEKERYNEGPPVYIQRDGKYVVSTTKDTPNYQDKYKMLFPRMYSSQKRHVDAYLSWGGVEERDVYKDPGKRKQPRKAPGLFANVRFFVKYQLGWMYFRYFMWNFSGRQNDIQGHGNHFQGNWITGVPSFDDAMYGSQDNMPSGLANNKAKNAYFLLPLFFGVLGLVYQYLRCGKSFIIVLLLFFFTGIAIVIYLNQYPYQPRERDYAYSGSFYAFAVWIGLGTMALFDAARKLNWRNYFVLGGVGVGISVFFFLVSSMFGMGSSISMIVLFLIGLYLLVIGFMKVMGFIKSKVVHAIIAILLTIPVPFLMASENWDDHDRSDRYMAREFARNYLESCAPNSILITYGDNDTFPLWYAQEVEGIRTDVRVLCFTLFNTDWYVDQMARKAYESEAMQFSMSHDQYVQGTRDLVYCIEHKDYKKPFLDLTEAMNFIASDDTRSKLPNADNLDFIPCKTLRLMVDSATVMNNGTVDTVDADQIVPYIDLKVKGNFLQKNELFLLDFLAQNKWERPVYFTSMGDMAVSFRDYLQLEGFAYRLVPIKTPSNVMELGRVKTDLLYDNMMNKFNWGNLNKKDIYLDQTVIRTTNIVRIRSNFVRLAQNLINEGRNDSAIAVLDKCIEVMPNDNIEYDFNNVGVAEAYYTIGENEKANEVVRILYEQAKGQLDYYLSLEDRFIGAVDYERRVAVRILKDISDLTKKFNIEELSVELEESFKEYYTRFVEIEQGS